MTVGQGARHEMYLGDGVYASFDGYHVWLDLRGQDLTTRIGLEPAVFDSLIEYRDALIAHYAHENNDDGGDPYRCPSTGEGLSP